MADIVGEGGGGKVVEERKKKKPKKSSRLERVTEVMGWGRGKEKRALARIIC